MIRNTDGSERLYLSKGDQTIYIENCKIPQHHIDGIRFLYKQYNKKKSGVIINDTSGYSRNLQIVLFLKAVRHLFDKPVLVLCHEGTEHDWVEQFQTWTDLCDDVVLETEKPFVKKLVLINTMSNLAAFTRRDWSVLVMDGDRSSQQVLKLSFKADFKIWVTPVSMRDNLDKFSQIYKWLYPKEKFDKSQFTPDVKDPLDVVDKAVLLDAFMEDIVAKSEEQDASKILENDKKEDSPPIRISRKNKDATGTKIKRSKRKTYDDEDDAPLSKAKRDTIGIPTSSNDPKSTSVSNEDYENAMSTNYDTSNDFSIDNFKRKSIEEFDEDLLGDKDESNSVNNHSEINLYYDPDTAPKDNSDRLYEMDTLVFGNDTCNDQSTNINDIDESDIVDNKEKSKEQNNESNEPDLSNDDDTPSEINVESKTSTPINISNISSFHIDDRNKLENEISNEVLQAKNNIEHLDDRGSPSIFTMTEDNNEVKQSIIDEIKSDINELESTKEVSTYNESKSENNEDIKQNNTKHDEPPMSDELTPDIENTTLNKKQNESKENEITSESKSVTNDNIASVTNDNTPSVTNDNTSFVTNDNTESVSKETVSDTKTTHNCIEERMKEMQEIVSKKFKGSILDRLF